MLMKQFHVAPVKAVVRAFVTTEGNSHITPDAQLLMDGFNKGKQNQLVPKKGLAMLYCVDNQVKEQHKTLLLNYIVD